MPAPLLNGWINGQGKLTSDVSVGALTVQSLPDKSYSETCYMDTWISRTVRSRSEWTQRFIPAILALRRLRNKDPEFRSV